MSKKVIPNEALDILETSLKMKVISRSQAVMYVKPLSSFTNMGELSVAMEKASLDSSKYSVLLEEEDLKFVNYGYYFINEMLAKKFGGCVSNSRYWILYNETRDSGLAGGMYGYEGDHLPTAEEIIQYIEELYEKM